MLVKYDWSMLRKNCYNRLSRQINDKGWTTNVQDSLQNFTYKIERDLIVNIFYRVMARYNYIHKYFGTLILFSVCTRWLRTRGTSSPRSMTAVSCWPRAEPDWTSSRSRSPDDRWVKPYLATIFSHWVPLPEPGPPSDTAERSYCNNNKPDTFYMK